MDVEELEDRVGDEALDGGEIERQEDEQEDGEESADGDDSNVDEEDAEPATEFSVVSLVNRWCFFPTICLSPRCCFS